MRNFGISLLIAVAWAVCLCGLAAELSSANEGSLVGIGGSYHLMRGESQVRLVREFIRIEFSPRLARTVVEFEFHAGRVRGVRFASTHREG
jgi:hypothetical protein